ncbi:MAG: ATP-binding protein [Caldilineaceae bacterium]
MTTKLDQTRELFDDLVRDALGILLPAISVLVWIWASYVALFDQVRVWYGFSGVGLLLLVLMAHAQFSNKQLHVSVLTFLFGITAIVTVAVFGYANSTSLILFSQVILLAAVLSSPRGMWIVATLIAILTLLCGMKLGLPWEELRWPLALLGITALTAALGARRLFTALEWALTLANQAQNNAEEARAHRSELQRALQSLDIALSRLERANRTLAFAQEAAEKAYRFKSDFVANVSHELRTPLNLIIGFSEMMTTAPESYGGVPLPREYRGDMLATYRSARHLLDLINDVLDLSQIESGRMAIYKEQVVLQEVIGETVEIVRGLAEARKLELQVNLPATPILIELDRIRIRQVLLNLLTNAMRYTQQGWVRIGASVQAEEVTLTVADSGRGIAPDKLDRAFETFDRLDEEPLKEGSGLGLAISKKFVELHEGRMWIDSEVGKGTNVSFTLKLPHDELHPSATVLHISRPLRYNVDKPTVLVLHDDPRAAELLRRHIAACNFAESSTLAEAMAFVQKTLPQALLCDVNALPQWQSWRNALPAFAHIPLLSCPLPSMRHLGTLMGASDYLPKPVSRNDLAAALQRLPHPVQTVLVIDDDPHIVRLISRMLRSISASIRVLEAFGGEEGLEVAKSQHPDAVFVDLMMPGMSGRTFLEAMHQEQTLHPIPIIVVSVRSVEQESSPLIGELHLQRDSGFSLSEMLALLQSLLTTLTQADAMSPTNAAALLAVAAD